MPRGLRKKTKQYALDRFQEEDPESFFKYKMKSSYGMSQDEMEFVQALDNSALTQVKTMLNRGVDPNFILSRSQQTPLHLAIEKWGGCGWDSVCETMVRQMLFFGADPNAQDIHGRSPLHSACIVASPQATELLLNAGADVNLVDDDYATPLMLACGHLTDTSMEVVTLLVSSGAVLSCTNLEDQNALHILTKDYYKSSAALLTSSASFKAESMWAVRPHVVRLLLENGLSASAADSKGGQPLCYELEQIVKHAARHVDLDPASFIAAAKVLVCGGASVLSDDMEEIEMFLSRASVSANSVNVLATLVRDLHLVIPQFQLRNVAKGCERLRHRTNLSSLQATLEAHTGKVPSLAQLVRMSLRQALQGRVLCNTQHLPLPSKMKEYIESG